MNWVQRNQPLIENIRAYTLSFESIPPHIFRHFQGGSHPQFPFSVDSDRGLGVLLFFSALWHDVEEEEIIGFLVFLYQEFNLGIFKLNKSPHEQLQKTVIRYPGLKTWSLPSLKIPGILRSVCDFFFRHGGLGKWMEESGNGELILETLSQEIFLMGKTSPVKTRARYFLWLAGKAGCKWSRAGQWPDQFLMPVTPGQHRFMHFIGPLKKRRKEPPTEPLEKALYYHRFYRLLFPDNPARVFNGLDSFMKNRNSEEYHCQHVMGGCVQCGLYAVCPGKRE